MTVHVVYNAHIVTCLPWSSTSPQKHQEQSQDGPLQLQELLHYDWMVCVDGRIHSVGRGAEAKLAGLDLAQHKVVFNDAQSRIVIPGLWDCHCHIYR